MTLSLLLRSLAIVAVCLATAAVVLARPSGCGAAAQSGAVRLTLQPRADNVLIADATVELDRPGSVFIEYGAPNVGWLRTTTTAPATTHQVPIVRMRAQTSYQVRALVAAEDGCPSAYGEAPSRPVRCRSRCASRSARRTAKRVFH